MADMNFNLKINEASKFNDVNSDGLGEFEGWGTSLCWWANRLGYNKNLINQAVDRFYSPNGLDLNIGRYNIGGGDHVKETFHTPYYIDRSNKKVVYDLRTSGLKPEYFGTNMYISSYDMSTARYTRSDSDFGITSGSTVGTIEYVGYVNRLDSMTSFGGNLRYRNINVTNSGRYIVKFLLTLEGENNRNIAIRVNDVSKYSIDKDRINNNAIATNGNRTIYLVEFDGVYLSQGVNTIDFGSNTTDWCLDVIKMAVVRSKEDDYYRDWYDVPPNKKADIYDCLDHRQSIKTGSAMGNFFLYDLYNATYSKSEANFGIQSGEVVKNLYAFNNINKLDDVADTGGNATFNVDVKEEDTYDVILMLTLEGTNDRDMAIKVNGTKYSVGADVINNNIIASANNRKMYIAPFYEIHLNRGVNTIIIGGNTGWGLDFVKMCVVKTTAYGVLPENDDFLHNAHINRSDSVVPGYCTDVSKINTNEHNIEWYHKNFERVDEECGYAWNYDWNADRYQMNILKAIAKQRGEDFIAEAFSNSPPYFMTNSGCSSGANDSSKNNLRDNAYNAFAKYLADVIAHFNLRDDEVTFTSATGMNEPYTNYWGANSNKQEGCHFDQGYPQSRVIRALNWNLHDKGVHDCIVSGTDETSIDTAISSYNALDQYAKETISRIDTHSYEGRDRGGLRQLAENEGKNLWMSEVDGDFTKGDNAGEMSAPLGLAHRIIEDLMWMKPSAWILWDIVDMHCDTGNVHDGNDFNWLNQNGGYWGLTACNHDDEYIWCLKKYYAFGQFTRYIRPGHNIFPIDWNAIGSYDSKNNKVVIVAINTENSDKSAWFSFEQFGLMDTNNITAIRTSGSLNGGENWADVSSSCNIWIEKNSKWFTATLKANSITTFIVDDVYLIKPSDLNTEITIYKGLNMLTPTGATPEVGEYKVNILDTANCTAKLESDNKTITVTSIASNEASIKVSINIENVKTYEKSISVAKIISTEVIQKTVTRQSKLEQSLSGFKTTVSETYQTRSDMGTYSTTEQISSMLEQTSRDITATFNNGYKRGITQMNAEGIKVYHNSINGDNYTHMSPTGFYIKHKGTDVFKVDENGLVIQGYASDSSLKNLSDTYYNGYIRGITQINAEGVKIYHNTINGENYTHMSPTGFYIKHKGTDVFKVDENGLVIQGYASASSLKDLSDTYYSGYYQGITQINAEGVKIYHNTINGDNYTHMSPTGFYIKNKGYDIFKVDENGLEMKGNITGGSINIGNNTFVVDSSGQIKARTEANSEGQYLDISSSTYKIWKGSKCCMQIGFRDLRFENGNTVTSTPAIYIGADGINPYGGDAYNGNTGRYYARWYTTDQNNSQTTMHANMPTMMFEFNTRYKNANTGRPIASQIKMYADGDMRIAPVGELEIYSHKKRNAINADGDEELLAKFTSSTSDYYPTRIEACALCNMKNEKGLRLADYYKSSSGSGYDGTDFMAMTEIRANYYSDGSKFRTFRPHLDDAMELGSGSYRWKKIFASNSTISTSDRRCKTNIEYLTAENENVSKNCMTTKEEIWEFVKDIDYASYNFINGEGEADKDNQFGFILQDLLQSHPDLTTDLILDSSARNPVEGEDTDEAPLMGYNTGNYVNILGCALQQALQRIEVLENKLNDK